MPREPISCTTSFALASMCVKACCSAGRFACSTAWPPACCTRQSSHTAPASCLPLFEAPSRCSCTTALTIRRSGSSLSSCAGLCSGHSRRLSAAAEAQPAATIESASPAEKRRSSRVLPEREKSASITRPCSPSAASPSVMSASVMAARSTSSWFFERSRPASFSTTAHLVLGTPSCATGLEGTVAGSASFAASPIGRGSSQNRAIDPSAETAPTVTTELLCERAATMRWTAARVAAGSTLRRRTPWPTTRPSTERLPWSSCWLRPAPSPLWSLGRRARNSSTMEETCAASRWPTRTAMTLAMCSRVFAWPWWTNCLSQARRPAYCAAEAL
mmetsp:Transcript_7474/g.31649  ORF Transcript_7474/g.31649 Transcript_7474/m.31649 type:complete len:331 (-) Transcript_7474:1882-2874(-)